MNYIETIVIPVCILFCYVVFNFTSFMVIGVLSAGMCTTQAQGSCKRVSDHLGLCYSETLALHCLAVFPASHCIFLKSSDYFL